MLTLKKILELMVSDGLDEIWSSFTKEEKRLLIRNFRLHQFKKNHIIYAERETPEMLWCLFDGKAKLYKDGVGGRQQIVRLIRPVQYFGYRAYFAGEPYVSTAAAMETSILGAVPMEVVCELINSNKDVAWLFIHELSKNLGSSDTRIVNLTQKHLRGRLAEALIDLMEHYGFEEDGVTMRIYMSRDDLANLSNMTTSNAIRTLTAFVNEHLIAVDGRNVKIINESQLRKISKFG